jgi:hypothetical protein
LASFGSSFLFVVVWVCWWFWFGFLCSLPALKALWNGGFRGKGKKKKKQAKSLDSKGFEKKIKNVENFFKNNLLRP